MTTKIKPWGNSLGLRLPKSITQKLKLTNGSEVELREEEGSIIISPKAKIEFTLAELLVGMDKKGTIDQFVSKKPVGKEKFWQ